MKRQHNLIVIVGPTGVGKTELSISIARYFHTEIISCDSRQFYRELEIGTAKPSESELSEVRHHFINSHSIHDSYTVKQFESDALNLLNRLFEDNSTVVMTGGSGLFAKAVMEGLDAIPDIPDTFRRDLIADYEKHGLKFLQDELSVHDQEYFSQVDTQNPQRMMRALEIIRFTGRPFSHFRKNEKTKRDFNIIRVGLTRDRDELYQRIDQRMDQMITMGLFEEATHLIQFRQTNALQTVGYKEIFGYLDGEYDKEEAIRLLKRNSRRYAKRQLTWFKRQADFEWFHPNELDKIITWIENQIS